MPVTYPIPTVPASGQTFDYWRSRTNDLINSINNDVLRNGVTVAGGAGVTGLFAAGQLTVTGNTALGITNISGNTVISGQTWSMTGSTFSTTANATFSGSNTSIVGFLTGNQGLFTANVSLQGTTSANLVKVATSLDLTGATLTEGTTHFLANGAIAVAASLGANQNNYNPTNANTATVLILTASTPVTITGLVPVSTTAYRLLYVYNIGANALTLSHESASSTANNRFTCPLGLDFTLGINCGVTLYYDPSSLRWHMLDSVGATGGSVTFSGPVTIANTLAVQSNTTLQSNLFVWGALRANSTLNAVGAVTFSNTLAVTGATTLSNNLTVLGTSLFNANVTVNASMTVVNTATFSNLVTISSNAVISGNVSGINQLTATVLNGTTANVAASIQIGTAPGVTRTLSVIEVANNVAVGTISASNMAYSNIVFNISTSRAAATAFDFLKVSANTGGTAVTIARLTGAGGFALGSTSDPGAGGIIATGTINLNTGTPGRMVLPVGTNLWAT